VKNESRQDPLNFPPMLDARIAGLYGYVAGPNGAPTQGARNRWSDLREEWSGVRQEIENTIGEVRGFSDTLRERGVPAVVPEKATDEDRGMDGRS
jgi:hypothetical protein